MNRILRATAPLIGFAALAGLWACSASEQEKKADKKADQVKESADAKAKAVKEGAGIKAEAVKEGAEQKANRIEAGAEKTAEQIKEGAEQKANRIEAGAEKTAEQIKETGKQQADQIKEQAKAGVPVASASAKAKLNPTQGSQVAGTVLFSQMPDGVRVVADLTGLTPGNHGFHVHEKGDCSSPDGKSAGGHFNPGGHQHGGPADAQQHAGDMGNITADAKGVAKLDLIFKGMTLEGENSIIGRGLIVHAKADDLKTQPTGDAGDRLACGVIEKP